MDTDQLSSMAYDCMRLADDANDVLKSELGAACSEYRTENDYLKGILEDVKEIDEDPREYLDGWNLLERTDLRIFKQKIKLLREHIEKTISTPLKERGASRGKGEKSNPRSVRPEAKHYFFLNPYEDYAFCKCPKCEAPTKIRKFPLVIHIEPRTLFVLNKKCRFCTGCDLIITRQSEIESMMASSFENTRPEIIGNEYQVVGTLNPADWRRTKKESMESGELVDHVHIFKNVWKFDVIPGGWYPDKKE